MVNTLPEPRELLPGLSPLADRLAELRVPAEPLDPAGSWSQTYSILVFDGGAVCGHVTLARRPTAEGAELAVRWLKGAGPQSTWSIDATVRSRGDGLGSAVAWTTRSARLAGRFDSPGASVVGAELSRSGEVPDGRVVIRSGGRAVANSYASEGPVATNWQLFLSVQRLPRESVSLGPFTLVNQFELVKVNQRLTYRVQLESQVGGVARVLHAYDLLGPGTVPWTYWVDDSSRRLVGASSGLEAYVLGALPPGGGREREARRNRRQGAGEQWGNQ
jgi:hypothetical protein